MKMKRILIGVGLLLVVLFLIWAGVKTPPSMCNAVAAVRPQISKTFTASEFSAWVSAEYDVSAVPVDYYSELIREGEDMNIYIWRAGGYEYMAFLEKIPVSETVALSESERLDNLVETMDIKLGGILKGMMIGRRPNRISSRTVIECWGEPQAYSAALVQHSAQQSQLVFLMQFPDFDIFAGGVQEYDSLPELSPTIDEAFPIDLVMLTSPDLSTETLGILDYQGPGFKPWPGDWGALEIIPVEAAP